MNKNILRVSLFPLLVIAALSITEVQPGKENKGNNNNNSEAKGNQDRGQGNRGNNTENSGRGNQNKESGRANNDQGKGNNNQGNARNGQNNHGNDDQGNRGHNEKDKNNNDDSRGNSGNNGKSDNDKGRDDDDRNINNGKNNNGNGNASRGNGKSRKESIQWDRDENINWGFENYSSRKRPNDFKKVTVCHNTGDNDYPVTISVSENALKAHINHGDQVGECTVNYSDRWPANFIRTRENVYNNYQTTWETMSYSEALLRFAADKLLGIKSTFQTQRATLRPEEIQRRELLIMDLQNNVNSLENQLAVSRQRTDGLNININL